MQYVYSIPSGQIKIMGSQDNYIRDNRVDNYLLTPIVRTTHKNDHKISRKYHDLSWYPHKATSSNK